MSNMLSGSGDTKDGFKHKKFGYFEHSSSHLGLHNHYLSTFGPNNDRHIRGYIGGRQDKCLEESGAHVTHNNYQNNTTYRGLTQTTATYRGLSQNTSSTYRGLCQNKSSTYRGLTPVTVTDDTSLTNFSN